MVKKTTAFAILFLMLTVSVSAVTPVFKRYRGMYGEGEVSCTYLGTVKEFPDYENRLRGATEQYLKEYGGRRIEKLTKLQNWLIVQALNEFDHKAGELYQLNVSVRSILEGVVAGTLVGVSVVTTNSSGGYHLVSANENAIVVPY